MKNLLQISMLALVSMFPIGCSKMTPVSPSAPVTTATGPVISAQWGNGMNSPMAVAVAPDGGVFVSDGDLVLRYAAPGESPVQVFGGAEGLFSRPFGMAAVSDGIYVVDSGNARVQKISYQGAPMAVPSHVSSLTFVYPLGVGMGPDANLFVTDILGTVWKADPTSGATGYGGAEGPLAGQFGYPIGVAFMNSDVYVVDYQANKVVRFDPGTGSWSSWGSTGTEAGMFSNPIDVKTGSNGSVYVADSGNGRIQEFDANGNFLRQWGNSGTADQRLSNPMGIAVHGNSLYVADNGNSRVVKYDL